MSVRLSAGIHVTIADAFTQIPFAGNQAAVCLLNGDKLELSDELYQKIASEINLAETAFVIRKELGDSYITSMGFNLRWFTPTNEVPLCGHATLAAAAALQHIGNKNSHLTFSTASGDLIVEAQPNGFCTLDMPNNKPRTLDDYEQEKIKKLVDLTVAKLPVKEFAFSTNTKKLLVRLNEAECTRSSLETIKPKISQFVDSVPTGMVRGVIVTLKGTPTNGCINEDGKPYDFVSRYFSPWNGIPEDAVTGSAHTVLGPYWADVLGKQRGLRCRQCSSRGGDLQVDVISSERVHVGGHSTVITHGKLIAPL